MGQPGIPICTNGVLSVDVNGQSHPFCNLTLESHQYLGHALGNITVTYEVLERSHPLDGFAIFFLPGKRK